MTLQPHQARDGRRGCVHVLGGGRSRAAQPLSLSGFSSAGQTLQVWSHSRIGDIAKMPEPCLGRNAPAGSAGKAAILPVTGEVLPTEDTEGNSPDRI